MRRKMLYVAAILAAVMALQVPIMAFAEDPVPVVETSDWNINGDVTITDDVWSSTDPENPSIEDEYVRSVGGYEEGGTTTVNGDVTSTVSRDREDHDGNSNFPAVAADQGTVQVNGNVSSENTGAVLAENGGTVNVTGDVTSGVEDGSAVSAAGGSTVEIDGNVANTGSGRDTDENGNDYGTSNGIEVTGQSTVKVGGDVTVGSGVGINVNSEDDSKGEIEVGGSVSSAQDAAIITNAASDITISENVTGNTGIVIRLDGGGGTIEVLGAVKSTEDNASVIVIETDKTDKDQLTAALPNIVVGSLEGASGSPEDFLWISSGDNEGVTDADRDALYDAVYSQLLYYIAQDKFANATLSVTGADAYKNGYTSKEGKSLTVTVAAADGYEVSSVTGADVVRNADGTYTVVVQRGKGIDLNAVISAIVRAQKETAGSDSDSTGNDSDTIVIVVPAYAAAQKQFQTTITTRLKTLPAGGTLTLDMKDCISFNRKTFEVFSQRKDIDIKIIYTWKGKKYITVIPAGYDILSLLDANGYCGCLYLNSVFGSTELTK